LSDGTTTVLITDNDASDANANVGVITYIGPVGAAWTLNVTTGTSKPSVGSALLPAMDIATLNFSSINPGQLTIEFTDTDFIGTGPAVAEIGGNTDGSVTYKVWADASNAPFGKAALVAALGPFTGSPFSGSATGTVEPGSPYSLTIGAVINHPGGGLTGFDAVVTVLPSCPDCVDPALGLGAAAGCTVLQLTDHKVSITGPAGGIVGDICIAPNGRLDMSGDQYVTGTIKLGPGAKVSNSSGSSLTVISNVDLSAEIAAAYAANANAASLPCDQTFAKLDGKTITTINGGVGVNVICVGEISLSGKQIALNGPAGAKFILNITGKMSLTGGGAGPQIRVSGGVQPKDVLYNLIGPGQDVAFSGGGGGVNCCAAIVDGTLLAPYRKINLAPGMVNGQIISGLDISIVSGASVRCPPCP
jgi:choice-of-anchor A domain-containing protein